MEQLAGAMGERAPFDDLLIVIPGIGGSMLRDDKGPLWNPTLGLAGALLSGYGERLERLAADSGRLDDPDYVSAVQPYGLTEMGVTIPGLAALNSYKPLRDALTATFDLVVGDPTAAGPPANYYEFAYDWRRDIRFAAARLKALVRRELPRWNDLLPAGVRPRTVLVAHSMGGLVAKYYLDVLGGWKDCRSLITFGTPYRGAPLAADYLANGTRKLKVRLRGLSELVNSFPSVHQLLPRYPIVRDLRPGWVDGARPMFRVSDLPVGRIGALSIERARRAREDFHARLVSPPLGDDQSWIPVGGFGHSTVQCLEFDGSALKASFRLPSARELGLAPYERHRLASGDGTVPALAATPLEKMREGWLTWGNGKHATIHSEAASISKIVLGLVGAEMHAAMGHLERPGDLYGAEPVPGDGRGPAAARPSGPPSEPALDLRLDGVFDSDEPVTVWCGLPAAAAGTQVTLTVAVADGAHRDIGGPSGPASRTPEESGDGLRWTLPPLPPGAYQVTITAGSLGLVTSDVVEVLNPPRRRWRGEAVTSP